MAAPLAAVAVAAGMAIAGFAARLGVQAGVRRGMFGRLSSAVTALAGKTVPQAAIKTTTFPLVTTMVQIPGSTPGRPDSDNSGLDSTGRSKDGTGPGHSPHGSGIGRSASGRNSGLDSTGRNEYGVGPGHSGYGGGTGRSRGGGSGTADSDNNPGTPTGGRNGGPSGGGSQVGGREGATRGGREGDGTRGGPGGSPGSGGGSVNGGAPGFRPVILDLDGDGVELVSLDESSVFYDINGDGYKYNLGWASADDGLLVYDKDDDGDIIMAEEISFTGYVYGRMDEETALATYDANNDGILTDLEALAYFDGNNDGVLNDQDEEFAKLKVWQDLDQDGEVDDGELRTLPEANILEVNLSYNADDDGESEVVDGNTIYGVSSYQYLDDAGGVQTGDVGGCGFCG